MQDMEYSYTMRYIKGQTNCVDHLYRACSLVVLSCAYGTKVLVAVEVCLPQPVLARLQFFPGESTATSQNEHRSLYLRTGQWKLSEVGGPDVPVGPP